jgi:molecular chaperone DnaK
MTSSSSNEPVKVPLRIKLPFATEAEFIERYGTNVTRGGIFIATKLGKPEGTHLSFELVLSTGERLMRGEGVVQKRLEEAQPGKSGMLVRFTRIDSRTKALVDLIVGGTPAAVAPQTDVNLPRPSVPQTLSPVPQRPKADKNLVMGIDLGTTRCRAALVIDGAPRLVPIGSERGAFALPSVVAYDVEKQRLLIGSSANRHLSEHPEQAVSGFKRLMGRRAHSHKVKELTEKLPYAFAADPEGDLGIELGGRVYSMPEFAQHLMQELKDAAQEMVGQELRYAVLCVPAWYTDHQRGAMMQAGELAGLEVLSLLNEPSAVAISFGYGRGLARKRVLVYDLGGGTFDASVVEITGDDLEAVSTGGDHFLGGLDFDARVTELLIATLEPAHQSLVRNSNVAMGRIREAAESAKIALSESDRVPVHVPFVAMSALGLPIDLRAELDRSLLENKTIDLIERTEQLTRAVLQAAKLSPSSLDEVLLVGGQSRSPAVRDSANKVLGQGSRNDVDPAGAVALGAALFGHSLIRQSKGERGLTIAEVLASPIGVAVHGGAFRRVLQRNTRLPAEKSLTVAIRANETLRFAVLQGESLRADQNEYLGALTIHSERAGEMNVHFSVTASGRLTLTATSPTGKTAAVQFTTQEASQGEQEQLLAESPLPGEQAPRSSSSGLFTGIKKLFGGP